MRRRVVPAYVLGLLSVVALVGGALLDWQLRHRVPRVAPGQVVVLSLGRQPSGGTIAREVDVYNPLQRPLDVASFEVTCGCTAVTRPEGRIEVGHDIRVGVKVDTKGRFGAQQFVVTMTFTDAPPAQLIMMADLYSRN